jgi:anti-sigma B factor antagonist
MTIQASTRLVNGVAIVDISGQLRLGEGTGKLREVVQKLVSDGYNKILLNLGGVVHIDSSGIGELMMNFTTLRNNGGELKLMNLNKNVRNLLQVTRLYTIFDVHDDQAAALQAFH